MMIFVVFVVLWIIITLIGHLSWIAVAAFFKAVFQSDVPTTTTNERSSDLAAAQRVIDQLAMKLMISPAEAQKLRQRIDELNAAPSRVLEQPAATIQPSISRPHAPEQVPHAPEQVSHGFAPAAVRAAEQSLDEFLAPRPVLPVNSVAPSTRVEEGVRSTEVNESSSTVAINSPRAQVGRSLGEFLAAHNIRWGELISGLLIVVCSIGLVISLWSTITQMHRVIPSLIFLAGNTAIFGAGLYTFFRWRLQDTSRATLVIAILLVPLGILAGLSTGSFDRPSVMLNDPITVVSILAAGAVYVLLIWQASRALVGSTDAVPMTIGVAGPAAVLPLVPAAVRNWDSAAGMIAYVGSIAVAAAISWMVLRRRSMQGNVAGRRAMMIGVAGFSLAVMTGYIGFVLRDVDSGWRMIATATIPGMVMLAAAAGSISEVQRRPKLALAGSVTALIGILTASVILIPMMISQSALWTWGISFSAAACLAAGVFRSPRQSMIWTVMATLPISLAFLLSSSAWGGEVLWSELPTWKRLLGGQPMSAALLLGVFWCAVAWLLRSTGHQRQIAVVAGGWFAFATVNAAVLTVAPTSWMGVLPTWLLPVLLGGAAVSFVGILDRRWIPLPPIALAGVASAIFFAFWVSLFKPLVIGQPFPGLVPGLLTMLATAMGSLVAAEVLYRQTVICKSIRNNASGFLLAAAALAVLLVIDRSADLDVVANNAELAILALIACVIGWFWIGLSNRNSVHLIIARSWLLVTAITIADHFWNDATMTAHAWSSGLACWTWAAIGSAIVGIVLVRDLLLQSLTRIESKSKWAAVMVRFRWYQWQQEPWEIVSRRLLLQITMILIAAASALAFGSLVWAVSADSALDIDSNLWLPCLVFAAMAVLIHHCLDALPGIDSERSLFRRLLIASVFCWLAWQMAVRTKVDPAAQLVLATTLAATGCFLVDLFDRRKHAVDAIQGLSASKGLLTAAGLILIACSSTSLLSSDWIAAVDNGVRPNRLITLSVAAWWTLGAITTGWLGRRYHSQLLAAFAAVLTPAIVVLVMPLWLPTEWKVWGQSAAIVSGLLAATIRFVESRASDKPSESTLQMTIDLSMLHCVGVGLISCLALIVGILNESASLMQLHSPWGLMLMVTSGAIYLAWNRIGGTWIRNQDFVAWPILLTIASGHAALVVHWIANSSVLPKHMLFVIWVVAASISAWESCRAIGNPSGPSRLARWQSAALVVASSVACWLDGSADWIYLLGLVACAVGGVLLTVRTIVATWEDSRGNAITLPTVILSRSLGWFVIGMGCLFLAELFLKLSGTDTKLWTLLVVWVGGWTVLWRVACPDKDLHDRIARSPQSLLADRETMFLLLGAVLFESVAIAMESNGFVASNVLLDGLLWVRLGVWTLVALTASLRHQRTGVVAVAVMMLIAAVTVLGLHLGTARAAEDSTLLTIMALAIASAFTILVYTSPSVCRFMNTCSTKWPGLTPIGPRGAQLTIERFSHCMMHVSLVALSLVAVFCIWLLVRYNSMPVVPIAICGVALMAAALGELAERTGRAWLRHFAMMSALVAIAMWASVNVNDSLHPLVTLSTRWFVAWVFLAAGLVFLLPKLVGSAWRSRWSSAVRGGYLLALSLAFVSMIATLIQEAIIRVSGQTDELVKPLYLGMAATLALLALLATLAAIWSGPGFSYRETWQLSDRQRAGLVVAAQMLGGLTWFHLFLCKSPLASLGLRAYWPYVVMTLAFASVGITEWARRRDDQVLTKVLKQTALFLPLVPIIGFWLSGSWVTTLFGESEHSAWTYIQGRVSYQMVLVMAAVYYAVISFLWKSGRARLVSIVMGNLALWVILAQSPDWSFLTHPQVWLIPPALCVLIATHFHRESLGTTTASGIRYAATLVIYVTSTADMLIQGVGATIIGPIVLILLALLGAAAGVAFRVRPFLYLGATFVFIGVTSMVWYAQQQLDAVWPWWVFGISTGVMLMSALMAIEKNKPKLQRIALSLQQWEP